MTSKVVLVGQAPGSREAAAGRPFAWTAGRTLFGWLARAGLNEEEARAKIYFAAVCRCFRGKTAAGGDRVPDPVEVTNCSRWLDEEIELLRPALIITVGRLAAAQFMKIARLEDAVGKVLETARAPGARLIALPHPSGASTWIHRAPGKELLSRAIALLKRDPAMKALQKTKCGG